MRLEIEHDGGTTSAAVVALILQAPFALLLLSTGAADQRAFAGEASVSSRAKRSSPSAASSSPVLAMQRALACTCGGIVALHMACKALVLFDTAIAAYSWWRCLALLALLLHGPVAATAFALVILLP